MYRFPRLREGMGGMLIDRTSAVDTMAMRPSGALSQVCVDANCGTAAPSPSGCTSSNEL